MAGDKPRQSAAAPAGKPQKAGRPIVPTEPVDVIDGIPDRTSRPAAWKYILLAVIFLGWLAFLIYVALAGTK